MIKLGVTGGIGCGKSTISELFETFGIPVYIADKESKRLVATSDKIKEELTKIFDHKIYENGVLDKSLLASIIFNDHKKLAAANDIIHPEVEKDFKNWLIKHQHNPIIVHEAAILFESGFDKFMDKVVMVYAPLDVRIERVMKRDNISKEKVIERMQHQMSEEKKIELSDFVIINDEKTSLISQTSDIIKLVNEEI